MTGRVLPLILLAVSTLTTSAAATPPALTDLGTLGGASSEAYAINDSGQITGHADLDTLNDHAFFYSGGIMTDLGTFGGHDSAGLVINGAGQIAGWAETTGDLEVHAFLYSAGVMSDIGTLGGTESYASAVNSSGQVVGQSLMAGDLETHAFLYSGGVLTDLGTLGGSISIPTAINDDGKIVGYSMIAGDTEFHAFVYSGGVMTDLGFGVPGSFAHSINSSGQIVGDANLPGSTQVQAFVSSSGVNTYLGTLGGPYSSAININDAGTIIGVSNNSVPEGHGFLYSGGVMTDLGRIFPNAQNASGQVAGESVIGEQRAVLYSAGFTEDLGTFGGLEAAAYDINESGAAVGYADVSASVTHAFRRDPVCGDRIKDPTEDCDDGNSIDGDCCANDCSYPGPAMTCLAGVKTSLGIKNQLADSKDAIKWKWAGAAFAQADLGDPTDSTVYTLCISDSTGGVDRLVATLRINPTPIWENHDPDGFTYAYDNDLVSGVYKMQLKAGDAGKAKIQISARGGAVPMPPPMSPSELFDQDPRVTVQLFNDTTATCWSSEFSIAKKNKASGFKAKTP